MLLTCPRDNFVPVGSERREGEISSTYSPVVYLSLPTSNHKDAVVCSPKELVVYLSLPTSNHNVILAYLVLNVLYIFRFLHQTTTR